MKIKDLPKVDRPREKLISKGPQKRKRRWGLATRLEHRRVGSNKKKK